jgi:hypothetical protein
MAQLGRKEHNMNSTNSIAASETVDLENQHACPDCGCSNLRFLHRYSTTQEYRNGLYCPCNDKGSDIAAIEDAAETTIHIESGFVDDDLDLFVEVIEIEDTIRETSHVAVLCHDCYEDRDTGCWDSTRVKEEERNRDDEWWVECVGCNGFVDFEWVGDDKTRIRIKTCEA